MATVGSWVVYVRRSAKRATSADVSDETQEAMSRATLPPGATVEVIRDSGGHRSGATTDRDGYQELLARLRAGTVDGIAVYDLSRLHRNTANMLALRAELDRRAVPLRIATLPATSFDGAIGRYLFTQIASAAQLQRDLDSERMVSLTRSIFEAGGHRGLDPFGYRTVPGVRPRTLAIVEHEADVVRRIWAEVATRSTDEVAQRLNVEGIAHRADRPWTRDAVKDIVRRGRFYLGFVTHRRGTEEREGRHPAILDEATWQAGTAGARRRLRGVIQRSPRHRVYLLAGLLWCGACDHRLHGQATGSRGQQWRYYRCRHCPAGALEAGAIEADLLDRIRTGVLPDHVIAQTRDTLRDRLAIPSDHGRARRRLEQRRDRLAQLYAWGDITEAQYRADRAEVEREIAELPGEDRLAVFDQHRALAVSLAASIDRATPEQLREAMPRLVAWADTQDRALGVVAWSGPFAPFMQPAREWRPRTGDSRRLPRGLDWYLRDVG